MGGVMGGWSVRVAGAAVATAELHDRANSSLALPAAAIGALAHDNSGSCWQRADRLHTCVRCSLPPTSAQLRGSCLMLRST